MGNIATSRRLFGAASEAALLLGGVLNALYGDLRLGRSLFSRKKMPQEVKQATFCETWVYASALLIGMLEDWPARPPPSDLASIVSNLEIALLDVHPIDYRPQYDAYNRRYRQRESGDSELLGRELVLHILFAQRVGEIWDLQPFTRESDAFSQVTTEALSKLETGLRKVLVELWPPAA
jgi:hypothetical protein